MKSLQQQKPSFQSSDTATRFAELGILTAVQVGVGSLLINMSGNRLDLSAPPALVVIGLAICGLAFFAGSALYGRSAAEARARTLEIEIEINAERRNGDLLAAKLRDRS